MIEFIENIDRTQWDELVRSSPVSTWFQTPACFDFYSGLHCLEGFQYGIAEEGVLKGVIVGYRTVESNPLKQLLTRRVVINGGPLLAEDISDSALTVFLRSTAAAQGGAIFLESRNFNDYSRWRSVFEKCGWIYEPHYNFHIDTTSLEIVDASMGKSRRRDALASLKHGAEIVNEPTGQDIVDFFAVLSNLYCTKVKTPLFPLEFFQGLAIAEASMLLPVRYEGRIVGGTFCVCLPGHAVYEWFACGVDNIPGVFPSTLATWSAIRKAAEDGYSRFDMMGAGAPGDGGYGVRDFKAKFGGTLVEHGRFKHINSPLLYRIGELGVKILKKL